MNKKSSKGIKLLSLGIMLIFGISLLSSFGAEKVMTAYNNLSDKQKLEILKSSKVKQNSITTVEELDETFSDEMRRVTSDWKYLVFYAVMLISGVGLWMLMNWARITIILYSIVSVVLKLLSFSVSNLLNMSIFIVIIYFLTRPKVKEQFKKEQK